MSDDFWIERAQTAEAKLKTMSEASRAAIDRVTAFKANFGIKERSNGEIVIDYVKFVENLGEENAKELAKIIAERFKGS